MLCVVTSRIGPNRRVCFRGVYLFWHWRHDGHLKYAMICMANWRHNEVSFFKYISFIYSRLITIFLYTPISKYFTVVRNWLLWISIKSLWMRSYSHNRINSQCTSIVPLYTRSYSKSEPAVPPNWKHIHFELVAWHFEWKAVRLAVSRCFTE